MEATDRSDLGGPLRAPRSGTADQMVWHYELVSYAQVGDTVLHYRSDQSGDSAIVGWSKVSGPAATKQFDWAPHVGGVSPSAQPSWVVPLNASHWLARPVSLLELTSARSRILRIREDLRAHYGSPIYFPFNGYGNQHLRAFQGYLSKAPSELVQLIDKEFGLELELEEI